MDKLQPNSTRLKDAPGRQQHVKEHSDSLLATPLPQMNITVDCESDKKKTCAALYAMTDQKQQSLIQVHTTSEIQEHWLAS